MSRGLPGRVCASAAAALLSGCGDASIVGEVPGRCGAAGVVLGYGPASNASFEPPAISLGGIFGDWFACENSSCTELDRIGLRFTPDGQFFLLESCRGDLDPGESYCSSPGSTPYTYDGSTLSIARFQDHVPLRIEGDRGIIGSSEPTLLMRIDPPRHTGPCDVVLR